MLSLPVHPALSQADLEQIAREVTGAMPLASPKVAVVGAGAMGMNHLRVLKDFPEDQLAVVAIAEPLESARAARHGTLPAAGLRRLSRDARCSARPDVVVVVVPTHLHFEVAAHALDAGIHVSSRSR